MTECPAGDASEKPMTVTHEKESEFIHQSQRGQCQVPAAPLQAAGHSVLDPLSLWVSPRDQNPRSYIKGGQRSGERGARLPLSLKASGILSPTGGGDSLEMG